MNEPAKNQQCASNDSDSPRVKAEKLRVKESGVLAGPNTKPTERRASCNQRKEQESNDDASNEIVTEITGGVSFQRDK